MNLIQPEFKRAVVMTTASRDIPESYGPVQEMRLDDGTLDNLAACIGVNAYNLAKILKKNCIMSSRN